LVRPKFSSAPPNLPLALSYLLFETKNIIA
jgi:hypothetical protein